MSYRCLAIRFFLTVVRHRGLFYQQDPGSHFYTTDDFLDAFQRIHSFHFEKKRNQPCQVPTLDSHSHEHRSFPLCHLMGGSGLVPVESVLHCRNGAGVGVVTETVPAWAL